MHGLIADSFLDSIPRIKLLSADFNWMERAELFAPLDKSSTPWILLKVRIAMLDYANFGLEMHKMLLCKVGVGRSYIADDQKAMDEPVPEGYDSFYLISTSFDLLQG